MALSPHHGDDAGCQVMPAEQIGLELETQHVGRKVFDSAGLTIGAIVEERVYAAAGARENGVDESLDRLRLGVVHQQGFDAVLFQRHEVGFLAHRREHPPSLGFQRARTMSADP